MIQILDFSLSIYLIYFLFFIAALIEGPLVSFSMGYFSNIYDLNILIICFIAFLGDFLGDILHYFAGFYFNKISFISRRLKNFNSSRMKKRESIFIKLLFLKLTPPLTSVGLLYLGFKKVNFRKFISSGFFLSMVFSLGFVILGKFSGFGIAFFDNLYSDYISLLLKILFYFVFLFLLLLAFKNLHKFIKR